MRFCVIGKRRQLEEEDRAALQRAAIANDAAVRLDDAVADREAKAGAFANGLGREERLKELGLVLGRHTRAAVLHLETAAIRRARSTRMSMRCRRQMPQHRLFGIDHEVQDHLLQLGEHREHDGIADRRRRSSSMPAFSRCAAGARRPRRRHRAGAPAPAPTLCWRREAREVADDGAGARAFLLDEREFLGHCPVADPVRICSSSANPSMACNGLFNSCATPDTRTPIAASRS